MRLTRVIIENFRGIRRLKLYLDPVTVVIGENNHGKTSIFDVLGLCLGRPGAPAPTHFRRGDFHRPTRAGQPLPIRIALTFEPDPEVLRDGPSHGSILAALSRDHDGHHRLRVEFWGRPEDGRVSHRFVNQEGRPLDPQPPESALGELRRLHPVILLRFAQQPPPQPLVPRGGTAEVRAEQRARRALEEDVARVYHELVRARGPVDADSLRAGLAAARKLYDDVWVHRGADPRPIHRVIEDLTLGTGGAPPPYPEIHEGSGSHTLGLLMVLGALLDSRGRQALPADADPIIAIEEPETHLHPILLASTWDVIESLRAQTLVTTNSGELLSSVPMRCVRRLLRRRGRIEVHRMYPERLSPTELRRVGYHIRAKRGGVLFARCWLLVEGESEFWLMRQLAHVLGYDLEAEGVRCVEFAQCGVSPLLKVANDLAIEWHLLTDGDESGAAYAHEARQYLDGEAVERRISRLRRRDIERCFWYHGYEDVFLAAAGMLDREGDSNGPGRSGGRNREQRGSPAGTGGGKQRQPGRVIARAVRASSKPYLALTVAEEAARRGPDGVPPVLRHAIEAAVALARESVQDDGPGADG